MLTKIHHGTPSFIPFRPRRPLQLAVLDPERARAQLMMAKDKRPSNAHPDQAQLLRVLEQTRRHDVFIACGDRRSDVRDLI